MFCNAVKVSKHKTTFFFVISYLLQIWNKNEKVTSKIVKSKRVKGQNPLLGILVVEHQH